MIMCSSEQSHQDVIRRLEVKLKESEEIREKDVRDASRKLEQQLKQARDQIQVGSLRLWTFILYFIGVDIGRFTSSQ